MVAAAVTSLGNTNGGASERAEHSVPSPRIEFVSRVGYDTLIPEAATPNWTCSLFGEVRWRCTSAVRWRRAVVRSSRAVHLHFARRCTALRQRVSRTFSCLAFCPCWLTACGRVLFDAPTISAPLSKEDDGIETAQMADSSSNGWREQVWFSGKVCDHAVDCCS